ncbi:MAG: nucleoside triphosphate pyrophosphohydrolase [Alphaproteobacteria bacterium]|nr:nucleoside triphosphate pyrophosphohydrolase [Alphaproteobacteria bacterium]
MTTADPTRDITRLLAIMARLRDPDGGCPWDLQQSFATIAPYTIEEAHEVAEAIARGDLPALKDELGDLLLQVVFHARMAEEAGAFGFGDVVAAISDKMIRRHPHVFGEARAETSEAVRESWEAIKARERAEAGETRTSRLDGVPEALPALMRAEKLQKKAARAGFDWPELPPIRAKLDEELAELDAALATGDDAHAAEELGDVLFVLANLARRMGTDAEGALRAANAKFTRRFEAMERLARARGLDFAALSLAEQDALWTEVKGGEERSG